MATGQIGFFDPSLDGEPKPSGGRRLSVLITVKAAPNPSATYGETVCVAGISVELEHPGWVRLYPINFRELEEASSFHKYDIIEVDARPATADSRFESWRPVMSTLTVSKHLPPWRARRPFVDPYVEESMCALNATSLRHSARSLAAVRVFDVSDLEVSRHPGWTPDEQGKIDQYVNQLDLFGSHDRTALQAPRFKAWYRWRCASAQCGGHRQGILDWEFTALQRKLRYAADAEVVENLKARFLDDICRSGRDLAFYVGNQAKHRNVFSVLGAYYPPSVTAGTR